MRINSGHLAAWLEYQRAMRALPPIARADGGEVRRAVLGRARFEASLRRDAGLSEEQVDFIETLVGAVVVRRRLPRFSDGGEGLDDERARFGDEAVRSVLSREADVLKAWDSLLGSGGG